MYKEKKAFTLIELLVVIAIIGLLSTLSIIALNSARAKARDAKRISDVKQMQVALEMYYNDMGDYPASLAASTTIQTSDTTFLRVIPTPPTPIDGTECVKDDVANYTPTTYEYFYGTPTEGNIPSYSIGFCLGAPIGQGATTVVGNEVLFMTPAGIIESVE